jgi:hypothetical protein
MEWADSPVVGGIVLVEFLSVGDGGVEEDLMQAVCLDSVKWLNF